MKALTFRTHESGISGLRATLISAPVNVTWNGNVLQSLVPEFHAHAYTTDTMTKVTAWSVNDGICEKFISIESSYLREHHVYVNVIDNNEKYDTVFTVDFTVPDETTSAAVNLGYGIGFGDPLTDFTAILKTQSIVFTDGGISYGSDGFTISNY